jgi:hypothetical protein
MNESEKQFSFTRAASSTSGRAKNQIPISLSLFAALAALFSAETGVKAADPYSVTIKTYFEMPGSIGTPSIYFGTATNATRNYDPGIDRGNPWPDFLPHGYFVPDDNSTNLISDFFGTNDTNQLHKGGIVIGTNKVYDIRFQFSRIPTNKAFLFNTYGNPSTNSYATNFLNSYIVTSKDNFVEIPTTNVWQFEVTELKSAILSNPTISDNNFSVDVATELVSPPLPTAIYSSDSVQGKFTNLVGVVNGSGTLIDTNNQSSGSKFYRIGRGK